jgi:anti-sigma B factor antagonist
VRCGGRTTRQESEASLEVERRRDVCLVTPHGRIGELEAQPFQRELLALVDQGATKIVVDLSDVPFVASGCLGALMVAQKRVRGRGGYIRLIAPQPLVRSVLEITKLTKLFAIYRTTQAALAAK